MEKITLDIFRVWLACMKWKKCYETNNSGEVSFSIILPFHKMVEKGSDGLES